MTQKKIQSDEYGCGASALAGLELFSEMNRQTGRTSRMIERVKDGDTIICAEQREARRLSQELSRIEGKRDVAVRVVAPWEIPMSRISTLTAGRVFFDHHWIELYYRHRIKQAASDLAEFHVAISKTWPDALAEESAQRIHRFNRDHGFE